MRLSPIALGKHFGNLGKVTALLVSLFLKLLCLLVGRLFKYISSSFNLSAPHVLHDLSLFFLKFKQAEVRQNKMALRRKEFGECLS